MSSSVLLAIVGPIPECTAARRATRCIYSSRVGRDIPRDPEARTSHDANTGNHHRTFPARRDTLPAVAQFIADICAVSGVPRKACLRLTLLVEELFTNTVVHGHGADTEAPVYLAFAIQPGSITLTYEDTARPYDPFARVRVPDDTLGVEERPVGGLGVALVAAIAERVEYVHVGGKNRISLVIPTPSDS